MSQEDPSGVTEAEFPVPGVAGEHGVRSMPCLLRDLERRDAHPSRASRETGAQAVARIPSRVEPCGGHPIAKDQGHSFAGQSTVRDSCSYLHDEDWRVAARPGVAGPQPPATSDRPYGLVSSIAAGRGRPYRAAHGDDSGQEARISALTTALAKVEGEHAVALQWFREHSGTTVSWSTMDDEAKRGVRLAARAKGIYKPRYTEYALSVRQTLNSPYADKEVIRRSNGSWVYSYYQENPNPAERDQEVTNRGLVKCINDGVPIGVLLQVKPRPGVEYEVLGLAAVREWANGYFILEGFSPEGERGGGYDELDAAYDRAKAATLVEEFNPFDRFDARERQIAQVIRRRGQAKFRSALIAAYRGRCVVTGCDAVDALEAAHISAYRGTQSSHVQNGLLLRADLHSPFDLGMLAIEPQTRKVVLADTLAKTSYADLAGHSIAEPRDPSSAPSREALAQHFKWAGIKLPRSNDG
jgi:putative restriction endonuclease